MGVMIAPIFSNLNTVSSLQASYYKQWWHAKALQAVEK